MSETQINFLSQNLSIERNFFKWDGKETNTYFSIEFGKFNFLDYQEFLVIPGFLLL